MQAYQVANTTMCPLAYAFAQVGHVLLGTRHGRWLRNRYQVATAIATLPTMPACPVAVRAAAPQCVYLAHVQAQLNGAVSLA